MLAVAFLCGCGARETAITQGPIRTLEQARNELASLEKHIPTAPTNTPAYFHWQNLNTAVRQARYLASRYKPTDAMLEKLSQHLDRAQYEQKAAASRKRTGLVTGRLDEGYHDAADDSFQPFLRYVPRRAVNGDALPMIVFLHGYSPALNIVNWQYIPETLVEFAEGNGFILAAPFGRSNTDYQGIGEHDVLLVIEEMQRRYRVDPDRIILVGISMGGMGAWTIAAHHPDLFAGLVVLSGRGDYYFWQQTPRESLPQYKQKLIDAEFASELLPNLASLPILCMHGGDDQVIAVEEARHITDAVRTVNPRIQYVELPGEDHWIFDEAFAREDMRSWLPACRRTTPTAFSFRTYQAGFDSAYGIGIVPAGNSTDPAGFEYRVDGTRLALRATNVSQFVLFRDDMPHAIGSLAPASAGNTPVRLFDKGNPPPAAQPHGPIKQAFLTPFAFVCTADPTNSAGMMEFQRRCREWYRFAKADPRTLYECSMNSNNLSEFNVFIFGEPEKSALVRAVIAASPVEITPEEYRIGELAIPRKGNGLYMVRPSPWNPAKLAVVQCGIPWGTELPENHKYDLLPDYIVYSTETDPDGSNHALCAGFFTPGWQLDPRLMTVQLPEPAAF